MEVSVESRARERSFGKVVNAKDRDEELAQFLEMRRREKDKEKNAGNLLLPSKNADELEATTVCADSDYNGGSAVARIVGPVGLQQRKSRVNEFLNSENEKSDYDWLITPPVTPLFPNLDVEEPKIATKQIEIANANVSAPKSKLANNNVASKHPTLESGLNSSSNGNRRPSSSGEPTAATRRSATPTGRPTMPSSTKPSRSSTPNSRAALSSSKPVAPPVRSSTPRPTSRSSTPTARPSLPASKSTSRSATPTQRPTSSIAPALSAPAGRSSSASKSRSTSLKNPVLSRGGSPIVKPRPTKSSEIPGFSLHAPVPQRPASASRERPGAPQRPASASRDRPGAPNVRPSSVIPSSNGKPRQQACSPSRGRASHGSATSNGNSQSVINRPTSNDSDDVNPVLMGTQMVERLVNMRKLAPPKQDDQYTAHNNSAGKSSSSESTGFGRTLSKKSFDMAMRHMDIRRSMPGNVRTGLTNIPASHVYSVRTRSTKINTSACALDSPLATCSNASSELSVNNIPFGFEGCEIEDFDLGSEKGNSSSSSQQGR